MRLAIPLQPRMLLVPAIFCLCLFANSGCGSSDPRTYWQHSRGYFVMTADKQWEEKSVTGQYRFVEVGRTPEFVELNDPRRNVRVRLFADHCVLANINQRLYEGGWERRPF